jgi:hypothetical protein
MRPLYETDFYSWTQEQAGVLRRAAAARPNDPAGLDWEHLAQEIWELGLSLEMELYHRYVVLICHLLKWRWQAKLRCGSWRGTIEEQRFRITRVLRKNPGLKPKRAEEFADAFEEARARALLETGLPDAMIPTACPFTLEEVEDRAFWPQGEENGP